MAAVLPSVEKLVRKVCAAQNAAGGSFGARVLSIHTGKEVSSMSSRVDKCHLTRRTPTAQNYLVGIDNYVVWCLNDTGSTYTIISFSTMLRTGLEDTEGC